MEKYYIPLLFLAVVALALFSKFGLKDGPGLGQFNNQATQSGTKASFPSIAATQNWQSINLETFTVKYPPFLTSVKYGSIPFGQTVEVANANKTQVLTISTGIDSMHTAKENLDFLDSLTKANYVRTTIDGSGAVISQVTLYRPLYTDIQAKQITLLANERDNKSQFSIVLAEAASHSDEEITTTFNQILSTFKFL